jgi:hypothetical protein
VTKCYKGPLTWSDSLERSQQEKLDMRYGAWIGISKLSVGNESSHETSCELVMSRLLHQKLFLPKVELQWHCIPVFISALFLVVVVVRTQTHNVLIEVSINV